MQYKVTEIQIVPIKPRDGLVGFASFVFDHSFYFSSIGIYTRQHGGYRLTYPTRKALDSSLPIFHPINKEISSVIEEAVINQFVKLYAQEQEDQN